MIFNGSQFFFDFCREFPRILKEIIKIDFSQDSVGNSQMILDRSQKSSTSVGISWENSPTDSRRNSILGFINIILGIKDFKKLWGHMTNVKTSLDVVNTQYLFSKQHHLRITRLNPKFQSNSINIYTKD